MNHMVEKSFHTKLLKNLDTHSFWGVFASQVPSKSSFFSKPRLGELSNLASEEREINDEQN